MSTSGVPTMQGSSLNNWILRVQRQLAELLDPTLNPYTEIDATEQLTQSCDANPAWTLLALAHLAEHDDAGPRRTLALTLIRRFSVRPTPGDERLKIWDTANVKVLRQVQDALLACIDKVNQRTDFADSEKNTLCKTVAFVHELDTSRGHAWPALETCLSRLISEQAGATSAQRDLYFSFVYENPAVVADVPVDTLADNLGRGLRSISSLDNISVTPIQAAVSLLQVDDRAMQMSDVIPEILDVLPRLADPDNERSQEALAKALVAFMELYNAEEDCPKLLGPYLSRFLPFVLSILSRRDYSIQIMNAAIEVLASTVEMDPDLIGATLLKEIPQTVKVLLGLMERVSGDALDRDFWNGDVSEEDAENDQVYVTAEQALDRITMALGGETILAAAFEEIPVMQASSDWKKRHAAMSAIATLAEGSSQQFVGDLRSIMQLVMPGLTDTNPRIVYAAVYCVAELCTYLEGAVQAQYGEAVLLAFLRILSVPSAPPRLIAYTCAALVNYTVDLEGVPASLLTHAPALFRQLHGLVSDHSNRQDVRLKAMGAMSQLASLLGQGQHLTQDVYAGVMTALWPYLEGQVDSELKARALDCASLIAVSAGRDMVGGDMTRLLTSFLHIQEIHRDSDDPCSEQAVVSLVRLAEAAREDFLPHAGAIIPGLLRKAAYQAEQAYGARESNQDENDEAMEAEDFVYATSSEGKVVRVKSEVLREKVQAIELLSSLAHSLGPGIIGIGSDENTTGRWTSFADVMLELASGLLAYEFSEEVRVAAAAMIPPLVRAFESAQRGQEDLGDYRPRNIERMVPALLSALAYETEPEALSALFSTTSEVVLAAPTAFSAKDVATFVTAVRDQIEALRVQAEAEREVSVEHSKSAAGSRLVEEEREAYAEYTRTTLEYMSAALQAVIKQTGRDFPVQGLFETLSLAVRDQLGLRGGQNWGLSLIADLIEHANPPAVAWTSGFLSSVTGALRSDDPRTRRIAAYAAGVAALQPEGGYAHFCRTAFGPLCELLSHKPITDDNDVNSDEAICAFDNVLSAIARIIHTDPTGVPGVDAVLPLWIASLPVRQDVAEMEACYSLLLELIAREHPSVSPEMPESCSRVLEVFKYALEDTQLPSELREPLGVGLRSYLSRVPAPVRQAWNEYQTSVTAHAQ